MRCSSALGIDRGEDAERRCSCFLLACAHRVWYVTQGGNGNPSIRQSIASRCTPRQSCIPLQSGIDGLCCFPLAGIYSPCSDRTEHWGFCLENESYPRNQLNRLGWFRWLRSPIVLYWSWQSTVEGRVREYIKNCVRSPMSKLKLEKLSYKRGF